MYIYTNAEFEQPTMTIIFICPDVDFSMYVWYIYFVGEMCENMKYIII